MQAPGWCHFSLDFST